MLENLFLAKFFAKIPKVFSHLYVVIAILVSFVIFSGNGMSGAIADVGAMFGASGLPFFTSETGYHLASYSIVLVLGLIGATPLVKNIALKLKANENSNKVMNILEPIFHVVMLLIITAYFVDGSFSPFLYFRF